MAASVFVRSPPWISGERAMDQSVINVRCSSGVKRVWRRPRSSTPSGSMSASGQCPGPRCGVPAGQAVELLEQRRPRVPEVVADPPHVGVALHVFGRGQRGLARARGSSTIGRPVRSMARRIASISRFVLVVRPADVVDLDEVDAPGRDQLEDGIVVGLRARPRHVHAVHVRVPRADVRAVRDGGGTETVPLTGRLRATASRGIPRIRWMPNCRPRPWT